jgi:hypothetical protein
MCGLPEAWLQMNSANLGSTELVRILALGIAATLPFFAGLPGAWVLDDYVNFSPIARFLADDLTLIGALGSVDAGPLGRPISELSFLVQARATGLDPGSFKLMNIALHGICAAVLFRALRAVFAAFGASGSGTTAVAAALVLFWAWLPTQVGTVLYAVQRMTLLATLFQLLAMLTYVEARREFALERHRAHAMLFVAVPLLTAIATLCKESGILVLLYCGIFELLLGLHSRSWPPRPLLWFFALFAMLPACLTLALLIAEPSLVTDGYASREFTIEQRLLSFPLVLVHYARELLVPWLWPPHLYRDGFAASSSLIEPMTTLGAWIALILVVATAILALRRAPLIAGGIAIFVGGHVLEGTLIPLELMFEHRNYLPSIGLVLVLAGIAAAALELDAVSRTKASQWAPLLLAALALPYGIFSLERAADWSTRARFMAAELEHAPKSRRLRVDAVIDAIGAGDRSAAAQHLTALASGSEGDKAAAAIWTVLADCAILEQVDPGVLARVAETRPPVLTHSFASWFSLLMRNSVLGSCANLDPVAVARAGLAWLKVPNRSRSRHESTLRIGIAALWLEAAQPTRARDALHGGTRELEGQAAETLAVRIDIALGDIESANRRLGELEALDSGADRSHTRTLLRLRHELASAAGRPAG